MSILQKVLEGHFEVRSYSGRWMNGKECLGVICNHLGQLFSEVISETMHLDKFQVSDLAVDVQDFKTDSMGKDMIVYFPHVPFDGEDEEEEDESSRA